MQWFLVFQKLQLDYGFPYERCGPGTCRRQYVYLSCIVPPFILVLLYRRSPWSSGWCHSSLSEVVFWVGPKDDSTTYQVVPLTTWILTLSCPTKRRKISVKLLAIYLLFDTHHTREVDVCKGLTISLKSRSQRKKVSAVKLKGCLNVHITSWVAWIRYSIVVVVAKLYRSVTLYGSFWRKSNNLLGKSPSPYGLEPELNL